MNKPPKTMFRLNSRASIAPRRLRSGVTVIETAIVMTMIVVVVVVLLGGLSGQIAIPFKKTSSALADGSMASGVLGSETGSHASNPQPVNELSNILIRFGIFAAVVFAFMAYTITFVTKAEDGPNKLDEVEKDPRRAKKNIPDNNNSLADFLLNRRSQIGRTIRSHTDQLDTSDLTVEMFMSKNPITASVDDELSDVTTLMRNRGFRHMLILGKDQSITGIISDRDLGRPNETKIDEVMTADPITVEATTSINIAITLLVKNRISALPVIHESKVVGVLTRSDLLVTLQCLMLNIQQQLAEARA